MAAEAVAGHSRLQELVEVLAVVAEEEPQTLPQAASAAAVAEVERQNLPWLEAVAAAVAYLAEGLAVEQGTTRTRILRPWAAAEAEAFHSPSQAAAKVRRSPPCQVPRRRSRCSCPSSWVGVVGVGVRRLLGLRLRHRQPWQIWCGA